MSLCRARRKKTNHSDEPDTAQPPVQFVAFPGAPLHVVEREVRGADPTPTYTRNRGPSRHRTPPSWGASPAVAPRTDGRVQTRRWCAERDPEWPARVAERAHAGRLRALARRRAPPAHDAPWRRDPVHDRARSRGLPEARRHPARHVA